MSKYIANLKQFFLFFAFAVIILYANWESIFLYESLFLDDLARYGLAEKNKLHPGILERNFLRAYLMYAGYELLTVELWLGRAYIAFWMTLAAFMGHMLLTKLGFHRYTAFFSSLAPAALIQNQTTMPAFIDGSYTVPGICAVFACLLLIYKFLHRPTWTTIFLILAAYYSSLELMDHSLFLAPALIWFILSRMHLSSPTQLKSDELKKSVILSGAIFLIAAYCIARMLFDPIGTYTQPQPLSFEQIRFRFLSSWEFIAPIDWSANSYINLFSLFALVPLIISICYFFDRDNEKHKLIAKITVFYLLWLIGSSIVFWFKSPYFSSRFFYISAIAFTALLGLGIQYIASFHSRPAWKTSIILITLFWAAFVVDNKKQINVNWIDSENKSHHTITSAITAENKDYPTQSQIAVYGAVKVRTAGFWLYSTNYLRMMIGKNDVSGFVGPKVFQFYNAFIPAQRKFVTQMTGLDRKKPVFIYRVNTDLAAEQMHYALIWHESKWTEGIPGRTSLGAADKTSLLNSTWEIVALNPDSGKVSTYLEGKGLKSYEAEFEALKLKGITRENIAWGGILRDDTKVRFGIQ